jgi:thiosulfate/3-mercaptopyruvate sulfurtransferase
MRYQLVDCRFDLMHPERGEALYLEGHVPGASFLDVELDLSDMLHAPLRGRHPLPEADAFAESASRAGIAPQVFVIAYDDGASGGAARLWWLLRHFGHNDVAVLAGGIGAWHGPLRAGREPVERGAFTPRPRDDDTITADELLARLDEPGLVVIDARAPERYRGDVEPLDPVAGHIPGAINWPYSSSGDVPAQIAEADEVVVYCGSGVTACIDLLALARRGKAAKLYPGSWSEWSRRGLAAEKAS